MLQDGPVRTAVPSGAAILDAYAQFDDLRSYLAHAALELSETEKGVMYWSFRLLRFSSGSATHSVLTMTDAEARNARRALSNTGRAVVAMFDRIEAALTSPAKPIAAYPAPIATGSYSLSVSSPAATAVTPAAARSRS